MNNPDISQEELIARRKINTIGFFDRVASQYDRTGPRFFSYFGQRMVLSAQISAGENVLDVAAGRGAVFFPAAQAVGATGNLIRSEEHTS